MSHLRTILLSGAALVALPLAAQAQTGPGFSGTLTLGYSSSSIGGLPVGVDLDALSIDVVTDIAFSDAFTVGLDFSMSTGSLDIAGGALDLDIDLIGLAIEPAYHFGNGAYVGVYYRMGDLDLSLAPLPIALGVDTESYGVFGGYEHGPLWVEGFIGTSDSDPGLPSGIDIMDYGIAMSYDINSQLAVFGSVIRTDIDAGGTDLDLTAISVGADYDFGNGLSAYGSVGMLDIGLGPLGDFDATGMTIGVAYDLASMGTPMTLNLEYSHTTIDLGPIPLDPDIDRFAIGVTIPLGGGSSEPLNSNTRTARGDYRSAIAALANSL
ncbi:porin [Roseicyclus persicicus]|uniref:Porin n=1 Tax=Roseicyclus persicicus TaxID=2650661 RepID=A0A7X6JYV1_9RHOB|nr:porin [Roseibacterium persicicum]NKX44143.1 porin [Roseibacterium persicicum]